MKKGLIIILAVASFVVGYDSGNKTTAKAETKPESQDATTNQDVVDLSQVSNVVVTEYGVQIEFQDGTGYWLEGYENEKGGMN